MLNRFHCRRYCSTLATAWLMLAAGCAGSVRSGSGAATVLGDEARGVPLSAKLHEQQRLIGMLRSLRDTSDAYERMAEARATIIEAVSWWATIPIASPPTAPPVVPASSTTCTKPPGRDVAITDGPSDPYAVIDDADRSPCQGTGLDD